MCRFAGRTLGAISLILLLLAAGLWARSYWFEDDVTITGYEDRGLTGDLRVRRLEASRGYLKWEDHRSEGFGSGPEPGCEWTATRLVPTTSAPSQGGGGGLFGGGGVGDSSDDSADRSFSLPLWGIVLPLAAASLLWMRGVGRRYREAARLRRGLCVHCGYDVRANKEVCPECGTPIDPAVQRVRRTGLRELRPIAATVIVLILLSFGVGFAEQRWRIRQHTAWAQYCLNSELKWRLKQGHFKTVRSLLNAGAMGEPTELAEAMRTLLVNVWYFPSASDQSSLNLAADVDAYEILCQLVEKGADLNSVDSDGSTSLKLLAMNMGAEGSAETKLKLARLMLLKGANPKLADHVKTTPLHELPCFSPDRSDGAIVEFARLLLDHGADINAKDNQGHTSLTFARWNHCEGLVALLVSRGGRE